MNKVVQMEDLAPLFTEILDNGGEVRFTPKGTSMLPMLHDNTDMVTLTKYRGKLKKYDLPLYYRRETKSYVLHRVIKVKSDGTYTMRGDNKYVVEDNIADSDVIAVVSSFRRNNKEHSTTDIGYKIYSRLWVNTFFIRKGYLKIRLFLGKIYHKIFG